jgi:hypothetical protein
VLKPQQRIVQLIKATIIIGWFSMFGLFGKTYLSPHLSYNYG